MITDFNSYRYKHKLAAINENIKELMAVRTELKMLRLKECQLHLAIKEAAKELDLLQQDQPHA